MEIKVITKKKIFLWNSSSFNRKSGFLFLKFSVPRSWRDWITITIYITAQNKSNNMTFLIALYLPIQINLKNVPTKRDMDHVFFIFYKPLFPCSEIVENRWHLLICNNQDFSFKKILHYKCIYNHCVWSSWYTIIKRL